MKKEIRERLDQVAGAKANGGKPPRLEDNPTRARTGKGVNIAKPEQERRLLPLGTVVRTGVTLMWAEVLRLHTGDWANWLYLISFLLALFLDDVTPLPPQRARKLVPVYSENS